MKELGAEDGIKQRIAAEFAEVHRGSGEYGDGSDGFGLAEIELYVELFFKEFGAALGVAEIFRNVATGVDLDGDGIALESGMQFVNALAMRMI